MTLKLNETIEISLITWRKAKTGGKGGGGLPCDEYLEAIPKKLMGSLRGAILRIGTSPKVKRNTHSTAEHSRAIKPRSERGIPSIISMRGPDSVRPEEGKLFRLGSLGSIEEKRRAVPRRKKKSASQRTVDSPPINRGILRYILEGLDPILLEDKV